MSKKQQIIKHTVVYALANQLTQFIAIFAGILTRNFLGPIQMGMWTTLQMVQQYSSYTSLGTSQGTAREVPYYVGKRREEKAEEVKNLTVSFQTTTALITSFGICLAALLIKDKLMPMMFFGLFGIAILIVLDRINGFLITLLRAYKQLELVSKQMVLSGIINLGLIALFTYPFKLYGFILAMLFSYLFNIIYNCYHFKFNFRYTLNRQIFSLISFGLPLMMLSFLESILKSIDKIMIVKMLGFEALGLYSVALMASNFLASLPNAIAVIIIPHFQEKFGERDSTIDLKHYVDQTAEALSYFMPLIIGICWIVLPFFVHIFLPKYIEGVQAAQVLILGSFFIALSLPFSIVIVTFKKHLWMFPLFGFTICGAVLGDFIAIKSGFGTLGVAWVTVLTFSLSSSLFFLLAGHFFYKFREGVLKFIGLNGWFILMLGVLLILGKVVSNENLFVRSGLRLILFLTISSPFIYRLEKKYGLISLLKQKILRI